MELIKGYRVPEGVTVIYPSNKVAGQVTDAFGISIQNIKEHPYYVDLMKGFISTNEKLFRGESTQFKTNDGTLYFFDSRKNEIVSLGNGKFIAIYENYIKNGIRFIEIRGLLIKEEILGKFKETPIQDTANWVRLPYDVFKLMVYNNEITGKDLIGFCVSNPDINAKCNKNNAEIFRYLLERDYNVRIPVDRMSNQKIRELYIEYSFHNLYYTGSLSSYGAKKTSKPTNLKEYKRVQDVKLFDGRICILEKSGQFYQVDYDSTKKKSKNNIIQMECGLEHMVLLDEDGQVWTIGNNRYGQLGRYGIGGGPEYVFMKISLGSKAQMISCGPEYTLILNKSGVVYGFGNNTFGQLGLNDHLTGEAKRAAVRIATNAKSISCGGRHSAFLDKEGCVWTSGDGTHGQTGLGDGNLTRTHTKIEGFRNIKMISCGVAHTAFLDQEGQVWTFGFNKSGQLGQGDRDDRFIPTKIEGFRNVKKVFCGADDTYIIDDENHVWSCGNNDKGKLGLDSKENRILSLQKIKGLNRVSKIEPSNNRYLTAFFILE